MKFDPLIKINKQKVVKNILKADISKSISKLSKLHNMEVITWKIKYKDNSKNEIIYDKNIIRFLISRLSANIIEISLNEVKVFNPNNFKNEKILHNALRDFYH